MASTVFKSFVASWGETQRKVETSADLDAVIGEICATGAPTMLFLESNTGNTLVVGVGGEESVLTFCDVMKSTHHSLGDVSRTGHLRFLCRDQMDEFLAEMAIPESIAIAAAHEFVSTRARPGNVRWESDWEKTLGDADRVWNRACDRQQHEHVDLLEGDRALAAMLLAHGLVMNGGVMHALGAMSESERRDAIAAFELFQLPAVAGLFSRELARRVSGKLENDLDRRYAELIPDDATLVQAFKTHYEQNKKAYAALA